MELNGFPLGYWSRMAAIEILLEILYTDWCALMPPEQSERFKAECQDNNIRLAPGSGPLDGEIFEELQRLVQKDLATLFERISRREANLRRPARETATPERAAP